MKALKLKKQQLFWVLLALLVAIQLLLSQKQADKNEPTSSPEYLDGIDTLVPIGFQLIPIRISNHVELGALINDFAVVDLFASGKRAPILQSVRLIRSPRDPNVFAVLVEQEHSALILDDDISYHVALRNPKQTAKPKRRSRRLILEGP